MEYYVGLDVSLKQTSIGRGAMVSSSDTLRAPERPTAIATLNRQRHLTPSCGGLTPTAERTVGPARISLESLTPRPGIREHNRHIAAPDVCDGTSAVGESRHRIPRRIRWSTGGTLLSFTKL